MTGTEVAERFFEATGSGDLAALEAICAPAFSGSQNGGPAMDCKALKRFTAAVHGAVTGFGYENAVCANTDSGFVEEHDVVCTLPDGPFRLRVCVVAEVADGQVTSMREYLDSAGARRLLAALSPG
jgi:ketosteroid isomerase-like protein